MPTPLVVYFCGFTLTGKAEIGLAYGLSAFDCDLHFRSSVNMHEEEKTAATEGKLATAKSKEVWNRGQIQC